MVPVGTEGDGESSCFKAIDGNSASCKGFSIASIGFKSLFPLSKARKDSGLFHCGVASLLRSPALNSLDAPRERDQLATPAHPIITSKLSKLIVAPSGSPTAWYRKVTSCLPGGTLTARTLWLAGMISTGAPSIVATQPS